MSKNSASYKLLKYTFLLLTLTILISFIWAELAYFLQYFVLLLLGLVMISWLYEKW